MSALWCPINNPVNAYRVCVEQTEIVNDHTFSRVLIYQKYAPIWLGICVLCLDVNLKYVLNWRLSFTKMENVTFMKQVIFSLVNGST